MIIGDKIVGIMRDHVVRVGVIKVAKYEVHFSGLDEGCVLQ